jgi:hypothetical protein
MKLYQIVDDKIFYKDRPIVVIQHEQPINLIQFIHNLHIKRKIGLTDEGLLGIFDLNDFSKEYRMNTQTAERIIFSARDYLVAKGLVALEKNVRYVAVSASADQRK